MCTGRSSPLKLTCICHLSSIKIGFSHLGSALFPERQSYCMLRGEEEREFNAFMQIHPGIKKKEKGKLKECTELVLSLLRRLLCVFLVGADNSILPIALQRVQHTSAGAEAWLVFALQSC